MSYPRKQGTLYNSIIHIFDLCKWNMKLDNLIIDI